MRISDVVKQIRAVLPNYTDLFGDAIGITSITASGNIATVTTTTAHGLSSGNAVTVAGVETRTPISSASQDGINFVFETGLDHDLTLGWPEHENIELGGFTDANWNTFTVSGKFNDGTYTPVNGSVNLNPRVAVVIDIDRALEEYTKQGVDDYWLFVEPMDAEVSKDRDTYSDATATIANGQDMRTRIIDGFVCYVVAPVTNQIAGEASLDVCRHDLLLPMMRTLYGTKFDTGLTNAADFRTILNGHGVAAYNKAYLVYRYEFQVTMDLTDDDTVLPTETRAFRDINYSLDVGRTTT